MIAYHVTARRNLGSIRRWGLIPRDTCLHHYETISSNRGVLAIYVIPGRSKHRTTEWVRHLRVYAPLAVIRLDIKGLEYDQDPATCALRIRERIPPSMIVSWEHVNPS